MGIETAIAVGGLGLGFLQYQEGKSQIARQQAYLEEQARAEAEALRIQADVLRAQQGALMGVLGGMEHAAGMAEAIGARNAERIREEGAEVIRKRGEEHEQTKGTAVANMAASGMKMSSGSFDEFKREMDKEHRKEIDWIKETVESQAQSAIEGGQLESMLTGIEASLIAGEIEAMEIQIEGLLAQAGLAGTDVAARVSGSEIQALLSGTSTALSALGTASQLGFSFSNLGGLFTPSTPAPPTQVWV